MFYTIGQFNTAKEMLINSNFNLVEKLLFNRSIISRSSKEPIKEPNKGDLYLLGVETDYEEWIDKYNNIALFLDEEWYFIEPVNGTLLWIEDEQIMVLYKNQEWIECFTN